VGSLGFFPSCPGVSSPKGCPRDRPPRQPHIPSPGTRAWDLRIFYSGLLHAVQRTPAPLSEGCGLGRSAGFTTLVRRPKAPYPGRAGWGDLRSPVHRPFPITTSSGRAARGGSQPRAGAPSQEPPRVGPSGGIEDPESVAPPQQRRHGTGGTVRLKTPGRRPVPETTTGRVKRGDPRSRVRRPHPTTTCTGQAERGVSQLLADALSQTTPRVGPNGGICDPGSVAPSQQQRPTRSRPRGEVHNPGPTP